MRLLFVVQRYGPDVPGGAEQFCRKVATRMGARGHSVEVLTSAARSYLDWADHYPVGTDSQEGVLVHRLGVRAPRDHVLFGALNQRITVAGPRAPLYLQREWMRLQGPELVGTRDWLEDAAGGFDVVVFFTYLYETTCAGLPVASRLAPTMLYPLAHDEPPIYAGLFDFVFRQPDTFAFLTEEEASFVGRRFGVRRPSCVTGIGMDLDDQGDGAAFRAAFGLGDRPYLLCAMRLDPHKGSDELYDFFVTYRHRHRANRIALVLVGEPVKPLPFHPDVVTTGYVDTPTLRSAIAGAMAVVMPSYFESFSMALVEGWAARKPALVQGSCDVLAGMCARSGGGIPYRGYAELEAAVDMLEADPALAAAMGESGRRHVESNYTWDKVLERLERHLELTAGLRGAGSTHTVASP